MTGAGIAQNASSRGMSVLLLEKNDFASGSSSKTSQLIHGGVPYLEQLHISLTRQHCEQRESLKRLAPHLVKDISFVLPFARNNTFFNIKATVGHTLYDLLTVSARRNAGAFLSKKKLTNLVPALSSANISGGIQFNDAITDDARLVLDVLKAAQHNGAVLLNYVQASGFRVEEGQIAAVKCRDRVSGAEFEAPCKICINAAGVWCDEIARTIENKVEPTKYTKHTYLVVSASSFETNSGLVLPCPDGRFIYVTPWCHALLIGSLDVPYNGSLDTVRASTDEVNYLLASVNNYTESNRLSHADVKACFAALSPQPKVHDHTSQTMQHSIIELKSGLFNINGGRLADYRVISEEMLEELAAIHPGLVRKKSTVDQQMLGSWQNKDDFITSSATIEIKGRRLSIDRSSVDHLISNYGKEAEHVVDLIEKEPSLNKRIIPDFPPLLAEVPFAVINEMAVSLQDFFLRRTRLGMLNQRQCIEAAPTVAELMGKILAWDQRRTKAELAALEAELNEEQSNMVSL